MWVAHKNPSRPERVRVTTTMALVYVSLLCLLSLASSVELDVDDQPRIIRAGANFALRNYTSILTVPNGEQFGIWMWSEMCPENFYAVGFSLRVTAFLNPVEPERMSPSPCGEHVCVC